MESLSEPPSEAKLQRLREEGFALRSGQGVAVLQSSVVLLTISGFGASRMEEFSSLLRRSDEAYSNTISLMVSTLVVDVVICLLISLAVVIITKRFIRVPSLRWKAEKRIYRASQRGVRSIVPLAILPLSIGSALIYFCFPLALSLLSHHMYVSRVGVSFQRVLLCSGAAGILVSVGYFFLARYLFTRKHRMTSEELRLE
jgi:flagellar biosynthesis protein FlhB